MTTTMTRPAILTPTGDPAPVEKAAVEGIADNYEPETLLVIEFRRPDGGARVWYAWTAGGQTLGDQIDTHAAAAGLDAADWIEIAERHREQSNRGRIQIQAYPLRPVLADVQGGMRAADGFRQRFTAAVQGIRPGAALRWLGFGPKRVNR